MYTVQYDRAFKFRHMTDEQTATWWAEGNGLVPNGATLEDANRDAFEAFVRKMPVVMVNDNGEDGIEIRGLCPTSSEAEHYVMACMNIGGKWDGFVSLSDCASAIEFAHAQKRYNAMGLRSA